MAGLCGTHQVTAFTGPTYAAKPISSALVKGNDDANRTAINAHDNDETIHVLSALLASRPAAGTAQRFFLSTDGKRAYLDNGSGWDELQYLPLVGGTVSGAVTFTLAPTFSAGVTGTLNTAAQPNVTSLGTLTVLAVAGAVTVTGAKTTLAATAAGYASLTLPHGTAPAAPANGDLWTTTAAAFVRINGVTGQLLDTATVRPGVFWSGTATQQAVALTDSVWTALQAPSGYTQVGTNYPTWDAPESTLTINETGFYSFSARTSVTAGSPTAVSLAVIKTGGSGMSAASNNTVIYAAAGSNEIYYSVSGVMYLVSGATVQFQALTLTAGVSVQIENYSVVRVG